MIGNQIKILSADHNSDTVGEVITGKMYLQSSLIVKSNKPSALIDAAAIVL